MSFIELISNKIYYCFVLLSIPLLSIAQNLDSLWSVWNDEVKPDTIRLKAMNDIVEYYQYDNPDSAIFLTDFILEMAEEQDILEWQVIGLNLKGLCCFHLGDFAEALNNYLRSLKIKNEAGISDGVEALYNNIGAVYFTQGDYPRALIHFQKSLKIRENDNDLEGIADCSNNIGAIYFYQNDFPKALEYYQRSLTIYKKLNIEKSIAASYNNIGETYMIQADYSEALANIKKSLVLREKIGDKIGMTSTYSNLGKTYALQGSFNLAQEYFQKGIEMSQKLGLKSYMTDISISRGKLFYDMGNYDQAILWCDRGMKLAEENRILMKQKEACECLYKSNKSLENDVFALHYHELFLAISDSLHLRETQMQLQQMEFSKQVEKDSILREKEKIESDFAHQEELNRQKTRKNISLFVGAGILIMAIGLYSRLNYIRKSRSIIQKEKEKSENLLLNILPSEVAEELKTKGESNAKDFENVTVLFTDFEGFTNISERLNAQELVAEINICFKKFDQIISSYGIEKIKTIGDAYMAAGGLHITRTSTVKDVVLAGLEMQSFMEERKKEMQIKNQSFFEMRLGIHTGPVVAGIVGVKKFQYDIWGDTVNIANRMESSGEIGKVNISEITYNLIKDDSDFIFKARGKIQAKNKGNIEMYFVEQSFQARDRRNILK